MGNSDRFVSDRRAITAHNSICEKDVSFTPDGGSLIPFCLVGISSFEKSWKK
jgi:hypothetical protein